MKEEFVTYPLALRLKVLGFKNPCFGRWWFREDMHNLGEEELEIVSSNYFELPEYYILAPTWQAAFEWFRKEYGFHVRFLEPYEGLVEPYGKWRFSIHNMNKYGKIYIKKEVIVKSYINAQSSSLKRLCKIVEEQ